MVNCILLYFLQNSFLFCLITMIVFVESGFFTVLLILLYYFFDEVPIVDEVLFLFFPLVEIG